MIGIRAHDMGKMPAKDLAKAIAAKGLSCIHLAPQKALTDYDFSSGKLNPGMAKEIRKAFAAQGVLISVLGCYINPVHPEVYTRRASLTRFKEHIRFVRDFGCSIVATETGSLNLDWSFHAQNNTPGVFETLVESVQELVREAEKFGVFVCLEPAAAHTVSTPAIMNRVLDRIPSNNLQVLFDPANLMNAANLGQQREIIQEAFELFGDRILAVHAKDFIMDNGVKKSVPIGEGLMDYPYVFQLLSKQKPGVEILMEDTRPEWIEQGIRTIEKYCSPV